MFKYKLVPLIILQLFSCSLQFYINYFRLRNQYTKIFYVSFISCDLDFMLLALLNTTTHFYAFSFSHVRPQALYDVRKPQGTSHLSWHSGRHAVQRCYRTRPGGVPSPSAPVPFGAKRRRLGCDGRLERCALWRWKTKNGICQDFLPQVSRSMMAYP